MTTRTISAVCLIPFMLVGCSSTIHKTVDIDGGKGLSIDAKQRLVLVTNKGGRNKDRRIVCAEPSPDALVAAAAAASGSGGTLNFGLGLAGSRSEAAASIGLRTQTIQLLRDGYYRMCEAYMNGALSRDGYIFALANIDKVMIPLMAIDTIAGTPRPPAVAISPGVAGTTTDVSLTGSTPTNGEAAGADTGSGGSLGASSSVGSTDTTIVMESVTQPRVGLNKDEARVLEKAIAAAHNPSHFALCASFLSDSGFMEAGYRGGSLDHKTALAESCGNLLTNTVDILAETARENLKDPGKKLVAAQAGLKATKEKLKAANAKLDNERAAHYTTMTDAVEAAKEVSLSATKHPSVIFTNGFSK